MPLALDPEKKFDLVLETDAERPPEERPTFVFRFLTGREWKKVAAIQESIDEGMKGSEAIDRIFEALALGVVGWRNIRGRDGRPIPFAAESLDLALTVKEAAELAARMLAQTDAGGEDRKKSASPSPSASENSAAAPADDATAHPR